MSDMLFLIQISLADLFSCNDMEALNKKTHKRNINAELILDVSDYILMRTDLTHLHDD